ncbi:sulfatase-like hydrolase/transferase [Spirosoma sp. HMF4905]|uniref:Sulfatase-like hydrolase/transferase n=1 Tax=Spirosoma arboris TaxID=2682092 RepID=A0A7K1S6B2_9BACT|nr:sulfatase [Spirosoma arboris]MVM29334.1 sulfatase-like hydrolase/transferase [Spirosoma arboris]
MKSCNNPIAIPLFLTAVSALFVGLNLPQKQNLPTVTRQQDPNRPNIVVILADDLGYGDISANGKNFVQTPNIDALAKSGALCTNGYANAPFCSPSRAAILTGRYQHRFGFEFLYPATAKRDSVAGLPFEEITLAEQLKKQGYATAMFGKWHIGNRKNNTPTDRGFDQYYGTLGGHTMYKDSSDADVENSPQRWWPGSATSFHRDDYSAIFDGKKEVTEKEYTTDVFSRKASEFIDQHKTSPFFLYVPFNAVHFPFQATKNYTDRFKGEKDKNKRIYYGMIAALDDAVGSIVQKLKATGLDKNTLIVFTSDNGGAGFLKAPYNGPLSGVKGLLFEGGIRVPYIVSWAGKIPAGTVYTQPVAGMDIYTTAVAASHGTLAKDRPYDGVDLLPYLSGKTKSAPHQTLFWRFGKNKAVRQGDWKLFYYGQEDKYSLFNLEKDIAERQDVSASNSAKVAELKQALATWEKGTLPPAWADGGLPKFKPGKEGNGQYRVGPDGNLFYIY